MTVYHSLYVDVAEAFIEYIHSLDVNEIQQLDDDRKANIWGVKYLLEIENVCEFLTIFQFFYYLNVRLPLTNGVSIVSDTETPEDTEKINPELLYEIFKDTKSHGLLSIQFLCALGTIFVLHIAKPKHAITKLYKSSSYET